MSITPTAILDNLDTVAVITGGIFAGSAFYVTGIQIPALRELDLNEYWRLFPYLFGKKAIAQSILTVIAGTAGIVHGTRIIGAPFYRNLWIAAGSTFLAIVPFTVICFLPINKQIIDDNQSVKSGNESKISVSTKKELLDKWATLQLVRTLSSIVGFGAMVFGLTRHASFVYTS